MVTKLHRLCLLSLIAVVGFRSEARLVSANANGAPGSVSLNQQIFLPIIARVAGVPRSIGLMGMPSDQFGLVAAWGGDTLYYSAVGGFGGNVQDLLDSAKAAGSRLMFRAFGDFMLSDGTIDYAALDTGLHDAFDGTAVLGDPSFAAYAMIDEPCDPGLPNLHGADMAALYQAVKAYDARVPVLHGFGDPVCAQTMLAESGGAPIADIASFTITYFKTMNGANVDGFLAEEAVVATALKTTAPGMAILPWIAVDKTATQDWPTESWVETVGMAVLAQPNYNGLMYFPWLTPAWAQFSLDDTRVYDDEIQRVFAAAP